MAGRGPSISAARLVLYWLATVAGRRPLLLADPTPLSLPCVQRKVEEEGLNHK